MRWYLTTIVSAEPKCIIPILNDGFGKESIAIASQLVGEPRLPDLIFSNRLVIRIYLEIHFIKGKYFIKKSISLCMLSHSHFKLRLGSSYWAFNDVLEY